MTAVDTQAPPCLDDLPDTTAVRDLLDQLRAKLQRLMADLITGRLDEGTRRWTAAQVDAVSAEVAALEQSGRQSRRLRVAPASELVDGPDGPVVRTYVAPEDAARHQRIVLGALEVDRKYIHHLHCRHSRMRLGAWADVHEAIHGPDHVCECAA